MKRNVVLGLCALLLSVGAACAPQNRPVPFPSAEALQEADYGPFPQQYDHLLRNELYVTRYPLDPTFIRYNAEPRQLMFPVGTGYEFGWGGFADLAQVDSFGDVIAVIPFRYLIRDGKIRLFEPLNAL